MAKHSRCEECDERKPDVKRVADPFALQINDEVWMRKLCAECYSDRCLEI